MTCPTCVRMSELEEENRQLRQELSYEFDDAMSHRLSLKLGVTLQQARIIAVLYSARGRAVRPWSIIDAMAAFYPNDRPDDKIVDVQVCRARKRVGRDFIESVWGRGYRLASASRARCDAILQPEQVAA